MENHFWINLNQNILWPNSLLLMLMYVLELEFPWFKQPVRLTWIKLNTYISICWGLGSWFNKQSLPQLRHNLWSLVSWPNVLQRCYLGGETKHLIMLHICNTKYAYLASDHISAESWHRLSTWLFSFGLCENPGWVHRCFKKINADKLFWRCLNSKCGSLACLFSVPESTAIFCQSDPSILTQHISI